MSGKIIGAKFSVEDAEQLEILAESMSQSSGRTVSVSALLRTFVRNGLEANPVNDRQRLAFRSRKASGSTAPTDTLPVDANGKLLALRGVQLGDGPDGFEALQATLRSVPSLTRLTHPGRRAA